MEDNVTPEHIYWVYKAYTDGVGKRLSADSSATRLVALASKDDTADEIRLLIGRYDEAIGSATVTINNYPYEATCVNVKIERIPTNDNAPDALIASVLLPEQILTVEKDSLSFNLDNVQNGEAYIVTISPC